MGYSAVTGTQLWNYTVNEYTLRAQYNFTPIQNDTYAWFDQNNLVWYGYNALTGQKIWVQPHDIPTLGDSTVRATWARE